MLARPAAVKLIRPEMIGGGADSGVGPGSGAASTTTAQRRFEREAQATAALTSPHTIEVYDFGVTADGTFYYVMELLDGVDLKTLVERYGPQPAERVVAILKQACHSLADAHATGLVHRDVKPANLFVCRRGLDHDFVKVLDFGLVKDAGGRGTGAAQLTVEGVTSGTPAFMAPEMATGSAAVDGRADLYALGCVAYWLLTGRLVFEGETAMAVLLAHAKDEPTPPSKLSEVEIPESLERLTLELLAKSPDDRPADAPEVLRRLREIESGIDAWTGERAARWWSRHRPEPPRWEDDAEEGTILQTMAGE
jgi:serine/threonine-protein kinase